MINCLIVTVKYSPCLAAFEIKFSSLIISKIILNLTMSVKFPPKVELILLDSLKTFFSTSSILSPARTPHT